jgi:hypothetical protein
MEYLASAGIGSSTIAIIYIAFKVFKKLEGHKLVSNCCKKKMEVGFAVEDMSPSHPEEKKNPPVVAGDVGVSKESLSVRLPASPENPEVKGI